MRWKGERAHPVAEKQPADAGEFPGCECVGSVVASGSSVHGVSHGSLASVNGTLWAFAGSFSNGCSFVHTRAYRMETSGEWTDCGVVVGDGFWPMQNPIRLANGNWIMGGLRVAAGWNAAGGNRPAVAISEGDDFTKWNLVVMSMGALPQDEWGEATVDLKEGVLTLTCRPSWGESPMVSHVARSTDSGLTWSALEATECRVVTAKPFTGTLSDGRRYLISTITADGGARRSPLMIAWSSRDGTDYSFAAAIRMCSSGVSLSYPSAVERDGKLYVGYSDNGGRTGTNANSAELAVVPLTALDECEKKSGAGIGNDATSVGIDTVASEVEVSASKLSVGEKIVFPITNKKALRRIEKWMEGGVNAGFLLTTDEAGSSQAAIQIASRENEYNAPTLHIEFNRVRSGLVVWIK